ncbi:hypothetical protein ACFL4T_12740, partial [candidate division KSB1 bacterium]
GEIEKVFHNDECQKCTADLSCCKMCVFYDPYKSRGCKETEAEFVNDKERRNYCGYYKINPDINMVEKKSKEDVKKKLDELFGKSDTNQAKSC